MPFILPSLPLPPPSLLLVPKVIFKKSLRFVFVDVFTYRSHFEWGQRFRQSHCCGELSSPVSGGGELESGGLAPLWGPPSHW